jgi:hypothetical protein
MRNYIAIIAMGTGVLLLAAAGFLLLAADATPTYAQIPAEAEYVGERECSSCHRDMDRAHEGTRHALTLQKSGGNDNPILGDFTQGDDVRQVQFPGEDTACLPRRRTSPLQSVQVATSAIFMKSARMNMPPRRSERRRETWQPINWPTIGRIGHDFNGTAPDATLPADGQRQMGR